jgi:Galactose-3-O-sulfotransferase
MVGDGEALIFLHIPKTAGQTVLSILQREYDPSVSCTTTGRPGFGDLEDLSEDARARIRFVYGHMPFGAHRLLPRPARYLAFLRDPTERAVSHWRYVRATREHRLYEQVRGMTLHEYVESSISGELDNGQTALIAGTPITSQADFLEPSLLETATRNVTEHFGLLGLTERFDESLLLARDAFGWSTRLYYRPVNVGPTASSDPIPAETLELIRERNRLDAELYRIARERLDAEIARRGPAFRRRVRTFRMLNASVGRVASATRA